jgi:hypothetical protein
MVYRTADSHSLNSNAAYYLAVIRNHYLKLSEEKLLTQKVIGFYILPLQSRFCRVLKNILIAGSWLL